MKPGEKAIVKTNDGEELEITLCDVKIESIDKKLDKKENNMKKISLEKALEMLEKEKKVSFKTVNQYNYTTHCININAENKTVNFESRITKNIITEKAFYALSGLCVKMGYECKGE